MSHRPTPMQAKAAEPSGSTVQAPASKPRKEAALLPPDAAADDVLERIRELLA